MLNCEAPWPPPIARGGRPHKYCSDACRWVFGRIRARRWCPLTQRHQRQDDTRKQRRHLRDQAEHLAQTAGKLALDLHAEDLASPAQQTGWKPGAIADYTATALPLLAQARAVLAAAVAADRAVAPPGTRSPQSWMSALTPPLAATAADGMPATRLSREETSRRE
ncbi:hypothetical protein [Nonomuraea guangzhouensis]|uniref:Uncharacterized protein n=1 Tax=Nonomuraea guangzhouensis TaxID=1291555 RepID=A0ABW4GUR9_9ACTN|nr:hypothetical protein [Nonomuraea guangzhouensis]